MLRAQVPRPVTRLDPPVAEFRRRGDHPRMSRGNQDEVLHPRRGCRAGTDHNSSSMVIVRELLKRATERAFPLRAPGLVIPVEYLQP